jgi:hypothetical protein
MRNKIIATLITLMFCMSVLYVPAYATEAGEPAETEHYADEADGEGVEPAEETTEFDTDAGIDPDTDADPDAKTDADPEPEYVGEPEYADPPFPAGSGFRPFTPDGTGTVIDNATDEDGKEFYPLGTEDGSVFYLIIDRQRSTENVYFLNVVTEQDLISLAEQNGKPISGTTVTPPPPGQPGEDGQEPTEPGEDGQEPPSKNNTGLLLIILAVVGVGGAVLYFKVIKGRKNMDDDGFYDGGDDDDGDYDYEPDPDDADLLDEGETIEDGDEQ